jgi:hypothetical protein
MIGGDNPDGTIPSSSKKLSFTDYNADLLEGVDAHAFVWTHRLIDYFEDLHTWNPENEPDDERFVRAYSSYAVNGSNVFFAGTISGNSAAATVHGQHDTYIVWNSNYGEEEFNVKTFNFDRIDEVFTLEGYTENGVRVRWDRGNNPALTAFSMRNDHLNNKTVTVDHHGRVSMPMVFRMTFQQEGQDGWYIWTIPNYTIHNLTWDSRNDTYSVYNIHPRGAETTGNVIPYPWDLDDDGFVDSVFLKAELVGDPGYNGLWYIDEELGTITRYPPFHSVLAAGYAGDNAQHDQLFHNAHVRATQVCGDNLQAMMWIDSSKSWLYNNDDNSGDLVPYDQVTEIFIVISNDGGRRWSAPMVINRRTHPEIGTIPTFVWPADRIFKISDSVARLYFMYTDDLSYGTFSAQTPVGQDLGSVIRYAAMDINIGDLVVSEANREVPRPVAMLNQNFPNPFNPSTTIRSMSEDSL